MGPEEVGPEREMPIYVGVKKVHAMPEQKDGKDGYRVVYDSGYVSWSPKDVFEEAYFECGDSRARKAFLHRVADLVD